MARKPRKPGARRKAKPRRSATASAKARGRRRTTTPRSTSTARRAAAARARKTAKATRRKKTGAKVVSRKKTGGAKGASRARRPAPGRAPSRTTAPARRQPGATAKETAAARPDGRQAKIPIGLLRERRRLREEPPRDDRREEENRYAGAARTGQDELLEKLLEHTETGPVMTGGDLDGNWEHAYSSGDEAPGGDNPTPDQGLVDDNGKALGIHYDDNEELRLGDKEAERDRHRWELDPASAEDYTTRDEE